MAKNDLPFQAGDHVAVAQDAQFLNVLSGEEGVVIDVRVVAAIPMYNVRLNKMRDGKPLIVPFFAKEIVKLDPQNDVKE